MHPVQHGTPNSPHLVLLHDFRSIAKWECSLNQMDNNINSPHRTFCSDTLEILVCVLGPIGLLKKIQSEACLSIGKISYFNYIRLQLFTVSFINRQHTSRQINTCFGEYVQSGLVILPTHCFILYHHLIVHIRYTSFLALICFHFAMCKVNPTLRKMFKKISNF